MAELRVQPSAAAVRTLADAERAHIMATLRETNWVVGGRSGAAVRLGLPRTTLLSRMHRLGLLHETPAQQPAPAEIHSHPAANGRGDLVDFARACNF
jgi:DNA-binding NtrC family response regulator